MVDWLSSLPAPGEEVQDQEDDVEPVAAAEPEEEPDETPFGQLVALGYPKEDVLEALNETGGDFTESLAKLSVKVPVLVQAAPKSVLQVDAEVQVQIGEPVEVEGISCALTKEGRLLLRLPLVPDCLGPVVGSHETDGSSIVFDGMDDWLWELYECHRPRPAPLPPSFDAKTVRNCFDAGAPYVWNDFATEEEARAAHDSLEAMFSNKQLARGSGVWVDECTEGGHARNRRALEGQRRDDACGFWDLQGGEPAPPPDVMVLFRRLEAAAEELARVNGWPLLCSRLGMAAVYDGHGAAYSQHRDNEWQRHLRPRSASFDSAGVKRRRKTNGGAGEPGAWMNFRELTMMAYVNMPGAFGEDEAGKAAGGRLRCYVNTRKGDLVGSTASELLDVAPLGGRAVLFRSRDMLHEVLASYGRRYSLVLWICTPHDWP